MSKVMARFLFESSPFTPFWSAWAVGFCTIGADGQIYLTDAGEEYLADLEPAGEAVPA